MNTDMDFSEVAVHCSKNDNYGMEIVVGGYIRKELLENIHNPPYAHVRWEESGKLVCSRFLIENEKLPETESDIKTVDETDIPLSSIAAKIVQWAKEKPKRFAGENDRTNWEAMRNSWNDIVDYCRECLGEECDGMTGRNQNNIQDMACCRPYKTGLPVNIWIDEAESYKNVNSTKCIYFQINKKQKFQTQNTCTMTLDGNIPEDDLTEARKKEDFDLEQNELEEVSNFVLNNSYALEKVADQLLWLDEFWKIFIKGGIKAAPEAMELLKDKTDGFVLKHDV